MFYIIIQTPSCYLFNTVFLCVVGNKNEALPGCPHVRMPGTEEDVVMFVKNTSNPAVFELEFMPRTGAAEVVLDDLTVHCGLEMHEESAVGECSNFYPLTDDDGCTPFVPITSTTTTTTTTTPKPTEKGGWHVMFHCLRCTCLM